ncbi:porin family protein [Olivibacter sitiensis]|uniref:porin family protein n=1 Tax=Olivibacter sitiensis TaxID=376470 RepID=UPI000483499B|nr:porin family protein [Olivibacter sitiensis]
MKKIWALCAILIVGYCSLANAQSLSGGVKGGVNIANMIKTGDLDYSSDVRVGFNAGGFLDLDITGNLGIGAELNYSQKGYKQGDNLTYTNNFVDLPLMLQVALFDRVSLHLGPQFSWLINSSVKRETNDRTTITKYKGEEKSYVGGVLGIDIYIGNGFKLIGNYTQDFTERKANSDAQIPTFKNKVWQIGLGYYLF